MPKKSTVEKAKRDLAAGKKPSTAAGEFVREEMEHIREGKHGARSTKQAIAIGLSKARRAGVPLRPPAPGRTRPKTRRSAELAYETWSGPTQTTGALRAPEPRDRTRAEKGRNQRGLAQVAVPAGLPRRPAPERRRAIARRQASLRHQGTAAKIAGGQARRGVPPAPARLNHRAKRADIFHTILDRII